MSRYAFIAACTEPWPVPSSFCVVTQKPKKAHTRGMGLCYLSSNRNYSTTTRRVTAGPLASSRNVYTPGARFVV